MKSKLRFACIMLLLCFVNVALFSQNEPPTITNRFTLAEWIRTGTYTFTNKTLTSPTLTTPTLTTPTLTGSKFSGTTQHIFSNDGDTLKINLYNALYWIDAEFGNVRKIAVDTTGKVLTANGEILDFSTDEKVALIFDDDKVLFGEFILTTSLDSSKITANDHWDIVTKAYDDSGVVESWHKLIFTITDPADESEDSKIGFQIYTAGTASVPLELTGNTLTLDNGATLVNSDENTLTVTEASVGVVGDLAANSLTVNGTESYGLDLNSATISTADFRGSSGTLMVDGGAGTQKAGTVVEKAGLNFKLTEITCTYAGDSVIVNDGTASGYGSDTLYAFPAGAIYVLGVSIDLEDSTDIGASATFKAAVGNVAQNDDTDQSDTGEANVIASQDLTCSSSVTDHHGYTTSSEAPVILDGTSTAIALLYNIMDGDDPGAEKIVWYKGPIKIYWTNLGDY